MEPNTKEIIQRLKKYWMLLALGGLAFVLIGTLVAKDFIETNITAPIAHIEPEGPLKVFLPPSKLDSYKKEMERINKENIKRKIAMEKIIAMDFGRGFPVNETAKPPAEKIEKETKGPAPSRPLIYKSPEPRTGLLKSAKDKTTKPKAAPENGFYTIKASHENNQGTEGFSRTKNSFFKAVINGDQKLIGNATVGLRLTEAAVVKGHKFPRNTLVYGRAGGGMGGRIKISITRIQTLPVSMSVYDNDYQEGIAYLSEGSVGTALADVRDGAVDKILNSIPYGGVASGLADLGKKIARKSRRARPLFLADGYPVFIAL